MNPAQILNPGCSIMVNNVGEEKLLLSHLRPHMRVLEFGSGLSTNVIAKLVRQVVSIEYNGKWYDEFKASIAPNVTLLFVPANNEPSPAYDDGTFEDFRAYVTAPMLQAAEKFDIVFIDGRARVACAEHAAKYYLKEGGLIFIHDYKHPQPAYRRPEYEVVEKFLDLQKHVFAMACFTVKGQTSSYLNVDLPAAKNVGAMPGINEVATSPIIAEIPTIPASSAIPDSATIPTIPTIPTDKTTCWYNGGKVVDEMNKFFDLHIKGHEIASHMQPFTSLLSIVDAQSNGRLLDLGCGTAMLTEFCKEFEYYGADLPHIIAGCAMRNYPDYFYRGCDMEEQDTSWIRAFDIVVMNGVIDIMQHPIEMLRKILQHTKKYFLLHRQEITESGKTEVHEGPGHGGFAWHSKINRQDFENVLRRNNFQITAETNCSFGNWENGGSSFLLEKIKE